MGDLSGGLTEYFPFYDGERPHQSMGQKTPDVVYQTAIGDGAMIVDRFPHVEDEPPVPFAPQGVRLPAQKQDQQQQQIENRFSTVQPRLKFNVPLKLSGCLS